MMITKGLVSVNDLLDSCQKGAWVMVKRNEGGIKVETPQAGTYSRIDRDFKCKDRRDSDKK